MVKMFNNLNKWNRCDRIVWKIRLKYEINSLTVVRNENLKKTEKMRKTDVKSRSFASFVQIGREIM